MLICILIIYYWSLWKR